jgi:hypothetical protein
MSHLNGEALARLVDEQPTPLERVHLEDCADCRAELAAMQGDATALGALGDVAPPAAAWHALEERLAAEGLLRRSVGHRHATLLRLAAALALFLTGTLAGFAWRVGMVAAPVAEPPAVGITQAQAEPAQPAPAPQTEVADAEPASAPATTTQDVARPPQQQDEALPRIIGPAAGNARFASFQDVRPRTAEEAAVLVRDAESIYLDALNRYAQLTAGAEDGIDPLARLAALEGIVLTTREALGRAPADPIINGYHMTALAQREATLRQIATSTRNPWF